MLTGEKRGLSVRRGMTVLGKIPAVPKPVNLPSQRLENRGLDPNIHLVPRGTVSWGNSAKSTSASANAWGMAQSSLLPANTGAWGASGEKVSLASGSNNFAGSLSVASSQPTPANGSRPSSAGSSTQSRMQTANSNAWGLSSSRPSSASGVLGQGSQSQPMIARPRSAEMRPGGSQSSALSRFAESTNEPPSTSLAWGGSSISLKSEEQLQPSRFILTPVDFPTLGSEKNHDLRPQGRPLSAGGCRSLEKERRLAVHQECLSTEHLGPYGSEARGMPDVWCKEPSPVAGSSSHDGNWHKIDTSSHVSASASHDSWRNEDSGGDDSSHPDVFHVGVYGPGKFHSDPFLRSPAPHETMPYRRGGPGPASYSRHGDIYGTSVQQSEITSGEPGTLFNTGMHPSGMPHEAYYGVSGPCPIRNSRHCNTNEQDIVMLQMADPVPGMYRSISQNSGPPEHFDRHKYHVHGARPCHQRIQSGRLRSHEGEMYSEIGYEDCESQQGAEGHLKGGDVSDGFLKHYPSKDTMETSVGMQQHGHHELGAAFSNRSEPTDFPKPVIGSVSSALAVLKTVDTSELLPEKRSARIRIVHHSSPNHVASEQEKSAEEKYMDEGKHVTQFMGKRVLSEHESIKDTISQNKDEASIQGVGRENWREDRKTNHDTTKADLFLCSDQNHEDLDSIVGSVPSSIISKTSQQTPLRRHTPSSANSASVEASSNIVFRSDSDFSTDMLDTEVTPTRITRILQPDRKASGQHFHSEISNSSDRVEDLKHNKEARPDSLYSGVEHTSHTELINDANMIHNFISKDDKKMKSRCNIHEGEKEWRPKASITQLKAGMSKPSATHIGSPAAAMLNVTKNKNIFEKGALKSDFEKRLALDDVHQMENLQVTDAYDYESQRAKLKEIAAQRSRQLQKEEEERTREQKAKAQAKLDELNRRTFATSNIGKGTQTNFEENARSVSGVDGQTGFIPALQCEDAPGEILMVNIEEPEDKKCNGSNRLGNYEEASKGLHVTKEQACPRERNFEKKKVSDVKDDVFWNSVTSTRPLLPSISDHIVQGMNTPLLESPESIQPQQVLSADVAFQKQNCISLQLNQITEQNMHTSLLPKEQIHAPSENPRASIAVSNILETANENKDGKHAVAFGEHSTNEEAGTNMDINEGTTAIRRKRVGYVGGNKNKHNARLKDPYGAGAEPPSCGKPKDSGEHLSSGDRSIDLRKGIEEALMKTSDDVSGDHVNMSSPILKFDFLVPDLSQEIAFGSVKEAIKKFPNDDILNKKVTLKSQPMRSSFKGRRSQDSRMIEKSPNEGLVWAVKPLSTQNTTGFEIDMNKEEISSYSYQESIDMNNETSSPSSYRSRRADLQRYNPKFASNFHGQAMKSQGQPASNISQPSNLGHGSSFQGVSDPQDSCLKHSNMTKSLSASDSKPESESHPNETAGACRTRASWKQRNRIENNETKHIIEHGESQLLQPRHINAPSQDHVNMLDGTMHKTKQQSLHRCEIDQQATKWHCSQDFSTCSQSLQEDIPGIGVVNSLQANTTKQNPQHDYPQRKILIDSATKAHNDDIAVKNSEKDKRNGRRDANRRSRCASSHLHSMEEPTFERDSNSGTIEQGLQKPLTGPPETGSTEKQQRQANGASSHQLQATGSAPKEQALTESSKGGHGISLWRQQGKYHPAVSNNPGLSEFGSTVQQPDTKCQINKQHGFSDLQKELQKERGSTVASLQKRQGFSQLQWQQSSTGRAGKSPMIEESEEVIAITAPSGDHGSSSLSKQRVPVPLSDHSSLNDARRTQRPYGQAQRQSQPEYHTESQSCQRTKPREHFSPLPASDDSQTYSSVAHCSSNRGDGFYFRPKDNKHLRRGHYRFSGGRGSNDMDRRQQLHGQGIMVDATVDPA